MPEDMKMHLDAEVCLVDGKGFGVAAKEAGIAAGVTVVSETPIVALPTRPYARTACCACLASSGTQLRLCDTCYQASFCASSNTGAECSAVHSASECATLQNARACGFAEDDERHSALWLLSRVASLDFEHWHSLQGLYVAGEADGVQQRDCTFPELLSSIWAALSEDVKQVLSWEDALFVLRAEAANSFGIGEADSFCGSAFSSSGARDDDLVGIALAGSHGMSRFNHSCLPNACWLQRREGKGRNALRLEARTLQTISPDEEICISYFPINATLNRRQKKLLTEYGFECGSECWRCTVERSASWQDDQSDDGGDDYVSNVSPNDFDGVGNAQDEEEQTEDGNDDERKLEMWMLMRLCDNGPCRGTMVPTQVGSSLAHCACSRCGHERTYEDVLSAIEHSHSSENDVCI